MGPEASRGRVLGVAAAVRPKGSPRPPALSIPSPVPESYSHSAPFFVFLGHRSSCVHWPRLGWHAGVEYGSFLPQESEVIRPRTSRIWVRLDLNSLDSFLRS